MKILQNCDRMVAGHSFSSKINHICFSKWRPSKRICVHLTVKNNNYYEMIVVIITSDDAIHHIIALDKASII